MSNRATFFNSENGDRIYNADSMRDYISTFFTNGVHQGSFVPTLVSGMTMMIGTGYTNINGDIQYFPANIRLTLDIADALYSRIDTIVLEHNENTRETMLKIVKGGYGSVEPQPPVRNDSVYQLVIAQITVPAAALQISQEDVVDTRSDSYLCGYISSKFDDIDFTQMTSQFLRYFEDLKISDLSEFNSWLENGCVDISLSDYADMDESLDISDSAITSLGGDMDDLIVDLSALKTTADATTISASSKMKSYSFSGNTATATVPYYKLMGVILSCYMCDSGSESSLTTAGYNFVIPMHMTSAYSSSATSVTLRGYFTYNKYVNAATTILRTGYVELTGTITRDTSEPKNSTVTFNASDIKWYTKAIMMENFMNNNASGYATYFRKSFYGRNANSARQPGALYCLYG